MPRFTYGYLQEKFEYLGEGVSQPYSAFACPQCVTEDKLDMRCPVTSEWIEEFLEHCGDAPKCEYCHKELAKNAWKRHCKKVLREMSFESSVIE